MSELLNQTSPQRVRFSEAWIARLFPDRRVDHHEPACRIDVDRLAADAEEHEHPPFPCEDPDLIAVAQRSRNRRRVEVRLAWAQARCVLDPSIRDDLPPAPVSIMGEQQSQAGIVAQHRVNTAPRCLLPRAVDEPGRIGFCSDRLPDFLLQVAGNWPTDGAS